MRDTSRYLSTGVIGLSAALVLLLAGCDQPAEEQGAVEAPATEQAPAAGATDEPAEGETTQQ